jgi:hypothetical protein
MPSGRADRYVVGAHGPSIDPSGDRAMTSRRERPEDAGGDNVLARRRVGWALALGGAAIVLYELVALVGSALAGPEGMDRGAVWTILLMILVTFLTVGGIGWGLYRTIRDRDRTGGS